MKLSVERLFDAVGERQAFSGEIDLSGVKRHGRLVWPTPLRVEGEAKNRAGILTIRFRVAGEAPFVCDRCLKRFTAEIDQEFTHTAVRSLSGEEVGDGTLVIPDGLVDLDEVASNDLQLELPQVILCREDCRGLCPVCGADRNEVSCGCAGSDVDSRFDETTHTAAEELWRSLEGGA